MVHARTEGQTRPQRIVLAPAIHITTPQPRVEVQAELRPAPKKIVLDKDSQGRTVGTIKPVG